MIIQQLCPTKVNTEFDKDRHRHHNGCENIPAKEKPNHLIVGLICCSRLLICMPVLHSFGETVFVRNAIGKLLFM